MNVPSKTTTVYILKHINGFKYHVVKDSHEVPQTVHPIRVLFLQCYFQNHIFTYFVSTNQSKGTILFKPKLSQKWPTIPYRNSRQHKRDTLAVQINPYWTYILTLLRHCSVIFMHILLYNMIYEREKPFLRHHNKCLRNFFCFYLQPLSKVKRTINVLQRWVSLLLHQSHALHGDSKQRHKKH